MSSLPEKLWSVIFLSQQSDVIPPPKIFQTEEASTIFVLESIVKAMNADLKDRDAELPDVLDEYFTKKNKLKSKYSKDLKMAETIKNICFAGEFYPYWQIDEVEIEN